MKFKIRSLFLIFLVLLCWSMASGAQVKWDVNVGFSGFFRPGKWTPVTLIIDYTQPVSAEQSKKASSASTIKGTIEVITSSLKNKLYLYRCEVEIPPYSRKRFSTYIKLTDTDTEVEIVLRDNRNRKILSERISGLQKLSPFQNLIVLPTRSASNIYLPKGLKEDLIKVAAIDPLFFPDKWFGFQSADLVLTTSYEDNMLDPIQLLAIEQWIESGGNLWSLGGVHSLSYKGQGIEKLLPVEINESISIDWDETVGTGTSRSQTKTPLILSKITPKENGKVLLRINNNPVIVQRSLGNGFICFWGADFTNPFFAISPTWQKYWLSLFPFQNINTPQKVYWEKLMGNLDMGIKRAARFPSLIIIFILVSLYAVIVGPVNFYILTKKKKLEWGWVTVPLIISVFTITIYGYAIAFKGRSFIKRDFEIWQTQDNSDVIHKQTHSAMFSSRRINETAKSTAPNSYVIPMDSWDESVSRFLTQGWQFSKMLSSGSSGVGISNRTPDEILTTTEEGIQIDRSKIDQWTLVFFEGESMDKLSKAPLDIQLRLEGTSMKGSIKNNYTRTLSFPFIYQSSLFYPLGELKPGQEVSIDNIKPMSYESLKNLHNNLVSTNLTIKIPAYDLTIWNQMLESFIRWKDIYPNAINPLDGEFFFCGLIKETGLPEVFQMIPSASEHTQHVMLLSKLYFSVKDNIKQTIDTRLVKKCLIFADEKSVDIFNKRPDIQLGNPGMILMSELPFEYSTAHPSSLSATFEVTIPQPSNEVLEFYCFNFQNGRWEILQLPQENTPDQLQAQRPINTLTRQGSSLKGMLRSEFISPINYRCFWYISCKEKETKTAPAQWGESILLKDITFEYIF